MGNFARKYGERKVMRRQQKGQRKLIIQYKHVEIQYFLITTGIKLQMESVMHGHDVEDKDQNVMGVCGVNGGNVNKVQDAHQSYDH